MGRILLIALSLGLYAADVGAGTFNTFAGTDFGAPNVNGTANVSNPTVGDMVYDTSANAFSGYGGGSIGWITLGASLKAPTVQVFTSGSGTYYPSYTFTVSSANATAGATYTNNGHTFTVTRTISGLTTLVATSSGAPTSSGTLSKASGTGDSTITFGSYDNSPLYIKVRLIGGGGGGGGTGSASPGTGGAGGNTTFGSLTGDGGTGSTGVTSSGIGGAGGTASGGDINSIGNVGGDAGAIAGLNTGSPGTGGTGVFGGGGASLQAGITNSGGGGSGALGSSSVNCGGGGGAGGYVEATIANPSSTYSYAVGAGGTAGTAGTGGSIASVGGSGIIIVNEYYQ